MIKLKRAYEEPKKGDGLRILVDRLWPRGVSKEDLELDSWEKDLAPTSELRRWFGHDPKKWPEFKKRYTAELRANKEALAALKKRTKGRTVTLIYGAKDEEHNNAVVLAALLRR